MVRSSHCAENAAGNLTFANAGGAGELQCFPEVPCRNITVEDVHINTSRANGLGCSDVLSGTFEDVTIGPEGEAFDVAKACNITF